MERSRTKLSAQVRSQYFCHDSFEERRSVFQCQTAGALPSRRGIKPFQLCPLVMSQTSPPRMTLPESRIEMSACSISWRGQASSPLDATNAFDVTSGGSVAMTNNNHALTCTTILWKPVTPE